MKTALLAAGALAAATLVTAPQADAAGVNFSLKLAGTNGVVQIAGPGGHGRHGPKFRQRHNQPRFNGRGRGRGWNHGWHPRRVCMSPPQVRFMLQRQGWHGTRFDRITPQFAVAYTHRRGGLYRVKVDRCAGRIIKVDRKGGFFPYRYF